MSVAECVDIKGCQPVMILRITGYTL